MWDIVTLALINVGALLVIFRTKKMPWEFLLAGIVLMNAGFFGLRLQPVSLEETIVPLESPLLSGSHRIHVLPPIEVSLSPELLCLAKSPVFLSLQTIVSPPFDVELLNDGLNLQFYNVTFIPVNATGNYTLKSVSSPSISANRWKIVPRTVHVYSCPTLSFMPPSDYECQSTQLQRVQFNGIPPFSLVISHESPHHGLNTLHFNADSLEMDLHLPTETPGVHRFIIDSITDKHGNTNRDMDISWNVQSHPVPKISSEIPYQMYLTAHGQIKLPFKLEGQAPFTLYFTKNGEPTSIEGKDDFIWTIQEPGHYQLMEIQDQFCSSVLKHGPETIVSLEPPPQLTIQNIPDHVCLGKSDVPLTVQSTLGSSPFWFTYRINDGTVQNVTVSNNVYELSTHPNLPGSYNYEIFQVGNVYYPEGMPVSATFKRQVHPIPSAKILGDLKVTSCMNTEPSVSISLAGQAPWSISLSVNGRKESLQFDNITSPEFTLPLKALTDTPGEFDIYLNSVSDHFGCESQVSADRIRLKVLSERPKASLDCPQPIPFTGGAVNISVLLEGEAPFEVQLKQKSSGLLQSIYLKDKKDIITVRQADDYELTHIQDAHCQNPIQTDSCKVYQVPQPSLSIVNDGINSVCQYDSLKKSLGLTGEAPFSIHLVHQHELSLDWNPVSTNSVNDKHFEWTLDTKLPGAHKYRVLSLSDHYYKTIPSDLEIEYTVIEPPTGQFVDTSSLPVCRGKDRVLEPLRVDLKGKAPFQVTVKVQKDGAELTHLSFNQVSNHLAITMSEFIEPGAYLFTLDHVQDASGCPSGTKPSSKKVFVKKPAEIIPQKSFSTVCEGDLLNFRLQGDAPFTIHLAWEKETKKHSKITTHDPFFSILAKESGLVQVETLCDRDDCCYSPDNIQYNVHSLPLAKIDNGQHISEHISEGEISNIKVHLSGQPPFSFSYTRSQELLNGDIDTETSSVSQVLDSQYLIMAAREGLYRITSVSDAYCVSPRPHSNRIMDANIVMKWSDWE